MTTIGDVGTEIAPEVADDPQLAAHIAEEDGRSYGLLQLSDKAGGPDFSEEDETRLRELAAFAGAALDALRATSRR
jgi:GAF domain-containing protein